MWEFWKSKSVRIQDWKETLMRKGSYQGSDGSTTPMGSHEGDNASGGSAAGETPRNRIRLRNDKDTRVNFKDLQVAMDDLTEESDSVEEGGARNTDSTSAEELTKRRRRQLVQRHKLIIIMVGLPGRGKTFLCNKLKCYLNWLGHRTAHINVGQYRRRQKGENELQDASFFDSQNQCGLEARHRALLEALSDLDAFLSSDEGQIAIFDATNTTEERRNFLIRQFHGRWQYMFIESICNDEEVLEANYKAKMMYSPDYKGVRTEMALRVQAVEDFKARIRKYEEVATTITNRNIHYIKLIDMVTGKGHMDINRISGYIPGKIVFYLMQVCKAGLSHKRKIWLSRHGESVYNTRGLIGGDSPLSPQGQQYADVLPNVLIERLPLTDDVPMPVSVWTSTLKRTCETAEHLPFPKLRWKALDEIHAGICDGMTYEQIEQDTPDIHTARKADKLRFRYPSGESYLDVIQRLEPVIIEMERERECVCIVAHQAVLRAIYGYFMNIPQDQIPSLPMPLHTLIELTPNPEGQMVEERISIPIPNTSRPTSTADADSTPKYPNVEHFPPQLFESPRLVTPKASMDRVVSADDTSSLMDQGLIARKLSPRTLSGTTLASI